MVVGREATVSRLGMQVEDLADDLPLTVDLQKREHVRESMTRPVVEFQAHSCDGPSYVDTAKAGLESRCGPVLVIPVKEPLDGTGEQVGAHVAEDRCVVMKGSLHLVTSTRFATVYIMLN